MALLPNVGEETIIRKSWFEYAEEIIRGSPGYGILKFFRHYPKVAHHIFYSVLLGMFKWFFYFMFTYVANQN